MRICKYTIVELVYRQRELSEKSEIVDIPARCGYNYLIESTGLNDGAKDEERMDRGCV